MILPVFFYNVFVPVVCWYQNNAIFLLMNLVVAHEISIDNYI